MRRVLAPLLVALCLVLAGCGGTGSSTTTAATATDAPDTTATATPSATPTPAPSSGSSVDLSLEVGARVASERLARAHAAALGDRSYTLVADQGVGDRVTKVGTSGLTAVRIPNVGETTYGTADATFGKARDVDAVVRYVARPRTRTLQNGSSLVADLRADLVVNGTVTSDGERRYVLTTGRNYSNASDPVKYVRLVADERGVVYEFAAGVAQEGRVEVQQTFALSNVSATTVGGPDWLRYVRDAPVDPSADVGTAVVVHSELDARLRATAPVRSLDRVDLRRNENEMLRGGFVEDAGVSPLVDPVVGEGVRNVTISLGYDEGALPAGADERNVSLFVYNETLQTFLQLNTSVDTGANRLTATTAYETTYSTGGGPEQTIRPPIAAPGTRTTVVALHVPTYVEAFRDR